MPEVLTTVEINPDATINILFSNIHPEDIDTLFADLGTEEGRDSFGEQIIESFRAQGYNL